MRGRITLETLNSAVSVINAIVIDKYRLLALDLRYPSLSLPPPASPSLVVKFF